MKLPVVGVVDLAWRDGQVAQQRSETVAIDPAANLAGAGFLEREGEEDAVAALSLDSLCRLGQLRPFRAGGRRNTDFGVGYVRAQL